MSFSVYLEAALLNHTFKNAAFTQPTNLYVALMTAAPADDATGSTITEPSGNGYARVNHNVWAVATVGTDTSAKNTGAITFPTATGLWGTISHFAICDAATVGNMLAYGTLTTAKQVTTDDTPSFASEAIVITLE